MANQTRFHRRRIYRSPSARQGYLLLRRAQVRRTLRAFEDLFRR